MKALVYEGPGRLALKERQIPVPGPGQVQVKVMACGICGSDVHGYLGITGRRIPGVVMGHEFSGVVSAVGTDVKNAKPGDRVIVQPISACGTCRFCEEGNNNLCPDRKLLGVLEVQGAMAEYVCVSSSQVIPMADACSFETGALAEPFAVAYAAVEKVADYAGKTVMIIGAGMIGLCILEMVKLKKPEKIIMLDLSSSRLERAKKRGADVTINPKKSDYLRAVSEATDGNMCDITIEAVGVEASANQSIEALKKNGVSIWTGVSQRKMTIDMQEIVVSQRTIIGSMNYTSQDFQKVVSLLNSGQIQTEGLITDRVGLEDAAAMFDQLHESPDSHLKAVIIPDKVLSKKGC